MDRELQVGSHHVQLSSLEKEMYPEDRLTKWDLVDYYHQMAGIMLPHMQDRPISMERFPDGINGLSFYEKQVPDHFPDWIDTAQVKIKERDETQRQVVCNLPETLVYLANQACIVPHIWLSRKDSLNHPDKMIFDLDPPGNDFDPVRQAALDLHSLLQKLRLPAYVMTTGSRGLHVVVPLDGEMDFDGVRDFAQKLATALASAYPDRLTTEVRKNKRNGRLFLDTLRNAYGQTSVAPYSLRAIPGAPVATPLDWDEVHRSDLDAQTYDMNNIFRRLGQKEDPWKRMFQHRSSLREIKEEEILVG